MAIFGLYFTKNMLSRMDWPRTRGLLKKQFIDSTILDSTIDQMVDWAAAIGAGKPEIALQIIAYMFKDSDWEGTDAPKIKMFAEEMNLRYRQQGVDLDKSAPHDIVQPVRIAKNFGPTIKPEALIDKRLQGRLEQDFLVGLLYGLSNRKHYEVWYALHLENFYKNLPIMKKAGLDVDKLPTLTENYANSEEIIRNYEQEMEIHLPSIPTKLLADARALGVKI